MEMKYALSVVRGMWMSMIVSERWLSGSAFGPFRRSEPSSRIVIGPVIFAGASFTPAPR